MPGEPIPPAAGRPASNAPKTLQMENVQRPPVASAPPPPYVPKQASAPPPAVEPYPVASPHASSMGHSPPDDDLMRRRYESFSARPEGLVPHPKPSKSKYVAIAVIVGLVMVSSLVTIAYAIYRYTLAR
jgi:hypothetical protein